MSPVRIYVLIKDGWVGPEPVFLEHFPLATSGANEFKYQKTYIHCQVKRLSHDILRVRFLAWLNYLRPGRSHWRFWNFFQASPGLRIRSESDSFAVLDLEFSSPVPNSWSDRDILYLFKSLFLWRIIHFCQITEYLRSFFLFGVNIISWQWRQDLAQVLTLLEMPRQTNLEEIMRQEASLPGCG